MLPGLAAAALTAVLGSSGLPICYDGSRAELDVSLPVLPPGSSVSEACWLEQSAASLEDAEVEGDDPSLATVFVFHPQPTASRKLRTGS